MASTLWTILCKVCSMMVQEEERTSSESPWSIPERMLHVRLWSQERCSNMLISWLMVRRISYISVSVQLLSCVWFFVTPWTAVFKAFLSITNSRSLFKLMSIELLMPSSHLILCHPLVLLPSIFPNIRVFPNESVLCIRWPKNWSFSFSISPSNE